MTRSQLCLLRGWGGLSSLWQISLSLWSIWHQIHSVLHYLTSCTRVGVVVVQLLSCVRLFVTPGTAAHQASLSFPLPELVQTHVHWFGDAIQPPHPLSSPSPLAFSLSQHQGLFQWVGSSHQVDKVLELQLQHQSFQWIFRVWVRLHVFWKPVSFLHVTWLLRWQLLSELPASWQCFEMPALKETESL